MTHRTLSTIEDRNQYLAPLVRFLRSAASNLRMTGSETNYGINPTEREVFQAFTPFLNQVANEYSLLEYNNRGELKKRFGSDTAVIVSAATGLPAHRPSMEKPDQSPDIVDLAHQAIALLQEEKPQADTDRRAAMEQIHRNAMISRYHETCASTPAIPDESQPSACATAVVTSGERRSLQDLTAVRYLAKTATYGIHFLRAWRTPNANAPHFVSHLDNTINGCMWYADNDTEPVYYAKLTIGPYVSPSSPQDHGNAALRTILNKRPAANILRLQLSTEDRDEAKHHTEIWLTDAGTYPLAKETVGSLFTVYES